MAIVDALVGNGVFVMFLAVLIGMGFGQLSLGRGIRFGVAGPLFAGLILGHFGFIVPAAYSGLTLALFVAAVGLIAAQEIEGMGNERKANLLRKYFLDAYDWIEQVHRALSSGGLFCLIVGPSTSYGKTIDTQTYLKDIALGTTGFELAEEPLIYKLVNNKMQYPTNGETTELECLLKFEAN